MAFVSIVLTCVIGKFGGFHNQQAAEVIGGHVWLANSLPREFHFSTVLYQALWGMYQGEVSYNGVLWTISNELLGSIFLFAFAALFFDNDRFLFIACIASAILVAALGGRGVYIALFLAEAALVRGDMPTISGYWAIPAIYLATQNPWPCPVEDMLNSLTNKQGMSVPAA